MTLKEIKESIENGDRVYWMHDGYKVVKDNLGQFLIVCRANNNCIGLTWKDGKTLNGEEKDFFTNTIPKNDNINKHEMDQAFLRAVMDTRVLEKGDIMTQNNIKPGERVTVAIRMKEWQKRDLLREAELDGRSLNNYMVNELGKIRGWQNRNPDTGEVKKIQKAQT